MSGLYCNEWEAYPAAWLRNLYPAATVDERSIDDVTLGQARRGCSSSGQASDGTSGRVPTPVPAIGNSTDYGARPVGALRGGGQSQPRAIRRTLHSYAGRLDSRHRSAAGFRLGQPSPASCSDRSPLGAVAVRGTRARSERFGHGGTRQSKAICCTGRVRLQTTRRIAGSGGRRPLARRWLSGTRSCTSMSSSAWTGVGRQAGRSTVGMCVHSCPDYTTCKAL